METNSNDSNPNTHTTFVKEKLHELAGHLREDIRKVNDPKAKALFETSAEVLLGLEKAFSDYEKKNEEAWKG